MQITIKKNSYLWLKLQVISKEVMNEIENESHLHFDYTTNKKKCRSFNISLDFLHKNLHC